MDSYTETRCPILGSGGYHKWVPVKESDMLRGMTVMLCVHCHASGYMSTSQLEYGQEPYAVDVIPGKRGTRLAHFRGFPYLTKKRRPEAAQHLELVKG